MADGLKPVPNPQSIAELTALVPEPGRDGYLFFENAEHHPLEKTTAFRQTNAWWAMELAYLAYGTDRQFVMEQLQAAGLSGEVFGIDRSEPPHALVAHNANLILVAFRGTRLDQLADIVADLSFFPELTPAGLVHCGFQKALLAGGIWQSVQNRIAAVAGNQVILFAGHSLGAALATLARRSYSDPRGRPAALYTFGSPRVGDELLFCSRYPGDAYRIVNDSDVVMHVPPPPLYGHVGTPLGTDGQPLPGSRWLELEHTFAGAAAALGVFDLGKRQSRLRDYFASQSIKPLADHAPRSYASKIWNALIAVR
ncbi:MAG: hypothetical protein C5B51_26115 [Terriglobia bacterium]|nr:MAG: hypothetical protein C5B51_26115 [Terriglobia bacterium]